VAVWLRQLMQRWLCTRKMQLFCQSGGKAVYCLLVCHAAGDKRRCNVHGCSVGFCQAVGAERVAESLGGCFITESVNNTRTTL
jgi:hypothetical protein